MNQQDPRQDEIIRRFYSGELRGEDALGMEARRAEASAANPASDEFFARQRRAIYARMGERPRRPLGWVPAVATAAALALGLYLHHPSRATLPAAPEPGDAQLFSELVSVEQSAEPRAALPIHALFEGGVE